MIDKSKLKELALAAKDWTPPEPWEQDRRYSDEEVAGLEFNAAANPSAILELLAELESARNAALEVLKHRDGALPTRGWLRDNDASRAALQGLADSLATTTNTEPASRGAAQGRITSDIGAADVGGLTPQLHADLRLAWKLVQDAGHEAAADRIFAFLASPAPSAKQEPKLRTATREQLYTAVIDCGHRIDKDKIVLYRDTSKEGNALSQLGDRLDAIAAPSASASPAAPVSDLSKHLREVAADPKADAISYLKYRMVLAADEIDRLTAAAVAAPAPAPVAGSQQVPEGWRVTLENIAAWLANSMQMTQTTEDDYGPASQFDYELGQAAAEIQGLLAAAPAVPVPVDQDQARDAARYRWLRNNAAGQFEHPIVVDQHHAVGQGMRYIGPLISRELDKKVDAAMAAPSLQQGKEGAKS